MAPRKPQKRRRDYKAETARRNELAREQGDESYYQRRVKGVPKGERAEARGHGLDSVRRRFLRELGPGDFIIVPESVGFAKTRYVRGPLRGRYKRMVKLVTSATDGRNRSYTFKNFTRRWLQALIRAEERKGATWSHTPSLDQRQIPKEDP